MFNGRTKSIRIIGDADNQRLDKRGSTVMETGCHLGKVIQMNQIDATMIY